MGRERAPLNTSTPIGEVARVFETVLVGSARLRALLVHSGLETGQWGLIRPEAFRSYCFGNAKASASWSGDYTYFACGENFPESTAKLYLADSRVTIDPARPVNPYVDAKGTTRYALLFAPKHPMTRFRAFSSLEDGARDHLTMMRQSFPLSWDATLSGDPDRYIDALVKERYFTADPEGYLKGFKALWNEITPGRIRFLLLVTQQPGESAQAWICRVLRGFDGAKPEADGLLYWLAKTAGEKNPGGEMYRATNCATTMFWLWCIFGVSHPWIGKSNEWIRAQGAEGAAGPVAWNLKVARDKKALVTLKDAEHARAVIDAGWGVYYVSAPGNDHVEWSVDVNDKDHCGGGRAGNKMTCGSSDVAFSNGRPAKYAIDPLAMGVKDRAPDTIEIDVVVNEPVDIDAIEDTLPDLKEGDKVLLTNQSKENGAYVVLPNPPVPTTEQQAKTAKRSLIVVLAMSLVALIAVASEFFRNC